MICSREDAVERQAEQLRSELAGPAPTPLEALLVERIVVCWLQVQFADTMYAQNMKDLGRDWGEYFQRRQERAKRRYLAAIRALAQLWRLVLPALLTLPVPPVYRRFDRGQRPLWASQ